MKLTEPVPSVRAGQPLVDGAGLPHTPSAERDLFETLDALMMVVETLCPRWPERKPSLSQGVFRL